MLKVGLTGGYATGKSFVASELALLGCHLIYADQLGHTVLEPHGEAYAATLAAFGEHILAPDRTIDRKRLAALVFASPPLLEKLTSFVHPAVFRLEEQLFRQFAAADPTGIAVYEAAILVETGRFRLFDRLILTTCTEETQIARGIARDNLTREQVLDRLGKQLPLEEKKRYAQYIVHTEGEREQTVVQVRELFKSLQQAQPAP